MKNFYHGSVDGKLERLNVISKCHDKPEIKCAYVTDNYAYSLFYLRDMDINIVTAWVNKDGTVGYEEQFENQLETIYKNQSGYIYTCDNSLPFTKAQTNGIFYSTLPIPLVSKKYIKDAYKEIQNEIKKGNIKVMKFKDMNPEKYKGLIEFLSKKIVENNFYEDNPKKRDFYKIHYPKAWDLANKIK